MSLIVKGTPDPQPSFEELTRLAEEQAGVPSDADLYGGEFQQEAVAEVEAPAEEPEAPVEAEDAPVEEPEVHPDQEQIPVEEPEPDPVAEMNKKLGQLLNDNADLRRQLESQAQPQEPEQRYTAPITDAAWFDELTEQNPAAAAGWALENQQAHLYDRAVRTWHDIDPVAAGRFERQVENAVLQQNIQQTFAPQVQGAQELANRAKLETAMNNVASRHDDYADVMATMTPDTIQSILGSGLPVQILEQGLQGGEKDAEGVFETLYRFQKAEVAGQLVKAARETPGKQDEETRQAKLDAFVGSASTATPDEVPTVSEGERMSKAWAEEDRSLSKAWKGQDSRRAR